MRDAKVHEIDRIFRKLEMETRNSYDLLAFFVHNGVRILKTRRSHGKGKFVPANKIRQQLKVNEEQFAGLISCDVSKQDYIKILTQKASSKARTEWESSIREIKQSLLPGVFSLRGDEGSVAASPFAALPEARAGFWLTVP